MNHALTALWALQQIDTRIHDLERQLEKLDTGSEATKVRDEAQSAYDAAASRLHLIETEMKDVDLTMKSAETKKKDFETRMFSGKVKAAKELEAMQAEVDMLGRNKDTLETRELELMDAQASAREDVADARALLEEKQKVLDAVVAGSADESKRLHTELVTAKKERAPQAQKLEDLDFPLFRKYEGLRPKLGNVAVSSLNGVKCSACSVQLTSGLLHVVRLGNEICNCESCGRILVEG